ncbi:MAG: hypothetical protein IPG86_16450 [Chitinophagaceae bacterium]|nr:hypothetical protein [Chitinophagaceae bacterium]
MKGLIHMTIVLAGFFSGVFPLPAQKAAAKPDLRVEELSLVSVTRDAGKKMYCIQVLIRVKNIGQGQSGEYQIAGYYNSPTGNRTATRINDTISVPSTAPGASFIKFTASWNRNPGSGMVFLSSE